LAEVAYREGYESGEPEALRESLQGFGDIPNIKWKERQ